MQNNMFTNVGNSQVSLFDYGTDFGYSDKKKYFDYKNNGMLDFNNDEKLGIKILEVLEVNGFPMQYLGTYLYKDVIRNIVKSLDKITKESEIMELKEQLNKPYSQFYFDIARNDRGIGVTTFHTFINDVISQLNYDLKNLDSDDGKNYGDFAYEIANYMIENKIIDFNEKSNENKNGKMRLLVKDKEVV